MVFLRKFNLFLMFCAAENQTIFCIVLYRERNSVPWEPSSPLVVTSVVIFTVHDDGVQINGIV
jgi:hypothetical protein